MQYLISGIVSFLFSFITWSLLAQSSASTYHLEAGEVLDILLLSQNPGSDSLFKNYGQTAFPVAARMSYESLPGFKVKELTQGNYQPGSMILGKWQNLEKREQFLHEIEKEVPDFHAQRRAIWPTFHLTYYEVPSTLDFTIDRKDFNVVTSLWQKEEGAFQEYQQQWLQQVEQAGGKVVLSLKDGTSPFGYYYQPDLMTVVTWDDREAYETFVEATQKFDRRGVLHLNAFAL
ncbi:hypothetical protein [Tunicatimonas pelagia]|uniref:hypothetical protein n=1 Tax=Tunicatimonas pelagia TaxID=931531 RepID=UPI0026656FDD|nr:hypothetical protein [Tunicatimonas pelagia]WKN45118.1 hypothetical protein P0M28_09095 [Tunicatimonas pelagia]